MSLSPIARCRAIARCAQTTFMQGKPANCSSCQFSKCRDRQLPLQERFRKRTEASQARRKAAGL